MLKKLANLFVLIYEFLYRGYEFATFQHFKLGEYEIHYLIDCGAGYMGGVDTVVACSIKDALKNHRQHDVEQVYCEGELVYTASWADLQKLS